jgi:hypothetical protein
MAKKKKVAKAGAAATALKSSPYVQRLTEDDDLRDDLRTAFESSRAAYERLTNGKSPQKVLLDDKKFQKELKSAAEALRDAGEALRDGPKRKKRLGLGKLLFLATVGAIIAVVVSEDLRNKVLDALFGAEEEFDYSSTTAPSTSSEAPQAAASG